MTETLFTKIINGEIPSYKVAEDDQFYAFLDISLKLKSNTQLDSDNSSKEHYK